MTSNQKALIAIILASILGGGIAVFVKIALQEIPVFSLNFFRFFIAAIFMLPIIVTSIKRLRKKGFLVILISLLATANTVIFSFGVGKTSATVSQILYAAVPLVITIISFVIFKERLKNKQLFGILLGFLGVAVIILFPAFEESGILAQSFWGNIIIFAAVICFSFYTVLSKQLHDHYSSMQLTAFFLLTSFVSQLVLAPIDFYMSPNWWQHVTWVGIISILYLGIFGMVLWYILYHYAIKHGTPTIASLTFYLQPITTFIWAYFLLHEHLEISFVIGAIITFVGLWITTHEQKSKTPLA